MTRFLCAKFHAGIFEGSWVDASQGSHVDDRRIAGSWAARFRIRVHDDAVELTNW